MIRISNLPQKEFKIIAKICHLLNSSAMLYQWTIQVSMNDFKKENKPFHLGRGQLLNGYTEKLHYPWESVGHHSKCRQGLIQLKKKVAE